MSTAGALSRTLTRYTILALLVPSQSSRSVLLRLCSKPHGLWCLIAHVSLHFSRNCLSVCLSVCLCVILSACLSVCLSVRKLGADQHFVWLLIQYYDDVAVCLRGIILAALAPAYAARNSRQVLPSTTHSSTCFAQHRQRPGLRFLATPCYLCVLSVTAHCLDTTH